MTNGTVGITPFWPLFSQWLGATRASDTPLFLAVTGPALSPSEADTPASLPSHLPTPRLFHTFELFNTLDDINAGKGWLATPRQKKKTPNALLSVRYKVARATGRS